MQKKLHGMAINFDAIRFMGVPQRSVDLDAIRAFIEDGGTKRINFAYNHPTALKRVENQKCIGWLNLPFEDTIESILCGSLSLSKALFTSPKAPNNRVYRRIDTEEEYKTFGSFIQKYKDLVFLRDTLDLSVALSMHESELGVRTALGEHEYQVKYQSENRDTSVNKAALQTELQKRLEELPYFKLADYICAVPSSKPFMRDLVAGLTGFSFEDISGRVSWQSKNGSLKDVETADEKLDMIQSWGLTFGADLDIKDKTILLVDDMYYSGVTMQYIALKMKEAGAKRVFGMALVKSLGN